VYADCASLSLSLSLPPCSLYDQQTSAGYSDRSGFGSIRTVPSIMQASLLDSSEASLRIIRFVPISSPHLVLSLSFSGLFPFDHHSRYRLHSCSTIRSADPVATTYIVEQSRAVSSAEPKDLRKHGYRIERRHFATGRKSHGSLG